MGKQFEVLALAAVLCLCLVSCGSSEEQSNLYLPSIEEMQGQSGDTAQADDYEEASDFSAPQIEQDAEIAQALQTYVAGASQVSGGECPYGDPGVRWDFYDNGTLVFSGQGSMGDGGMETPPWWEYLEDTQNVIVETGITHLGQNMIGYSEYMENIFLPSTLISIGQSSICINAMNDMPWNSLVIPYGVITIEESAFSWCTAMRSVTIPDTVTTIKDGAFYGCHSVPEITIPGSVATIERSFGNCLGLRKVVLEEGVTTIKEYAFNACGINELHLPVSLTTIEAHAFSAASEIPGRPIQDVYYAGTEEQWNAINIDNTDSTPNDPRTTDDNSDLLNATIHFNTP